MEKEVSEIPVTTDDSVELQPAQIQSTGSDSTTSQTDRSTFAFWIAGGFVTLVWALFPPTRTGVLTAADFFNNFFCAILAGLAAGVVSFVMYKFVRHHKNASVHEFD